MFVLAALRFECGMAETALEGLLLEVHALVILKNTCILE